MEGADSHNGGRTVIKIELDQGQRIIYKPYGVEKEWLYHQLSGRVYRRMGMGELELPYLCRDGYGWEPWLEHRACQDTGQVRRYFKRMGVHLFLAHLLSATDLHGENVMAVGEFPVIIDTETFPGLRFFDETADADHRVRDMIRYSVLRTGLLPGESWAGAAVNAIHSPGEQVLPFKIPVVEQDGTVKMRIGYSQARVNLKNSLPILDGYPVEPYGYREEVCSGFSAAYALWIEEKKEWSGYVHRFYQQPFRIVRRNTQQYAAFLSASLHPQYLMSAQKRRIFLERLHSRERGEDKSELKMEEYEIDALMDMDIPVFSGRGDSCSIFTGDGREYENYFPCQPDLAYMEESKFFTKTDCSIQQTMIRLSFERLRREKAEKTVREEKEKTVSWEEIMGRQVDEIGEYLFNTAVFDEKGTPAWMGVLGQPDGSWRCEPIGFDLYDGIPGIVIFLQQLTAVRSDEKYKDLLYSAKVRLFQYTEEWKKRQESGMTFEGVDEERTGAFFGVASGAYAYLILYHISGDREYLDYAKLHGELLEDYYEKDKHYDFVSGNAGAVYVLGKLFEMTGERRFLELAVRIGDWLWERAVETSYGWGWKIAEDQMPMTGMSHGSSGFLMAYGELLKNTGDSKYEDIIRKLLSYEDHFFSEELGNWLDLRGWDGMKKYIPRAQNTWCHGAPGILLSRLFLGGLPEFRREDQIEQDISRAVMSMKKAEAHAGMCICHGKCGNWMVLKYGQAICSELISVSWYIKEEKERLKEQIVQTLQQGMGGLTLLQEKVHPGFMTGSSGIGFALMEMERN